MKLKMITGLIGLILVLAFLAPPVIKLKSIALAVIVLIGVVMVVYEFIENLRGKGE